MRDRRWKLVALLAAGIAIGVVMMGTPAGAHVGGSVSHLWNQHIKPKTDARYYTKSQANGRFLPGGNLPAGRTVRGTYWMGDIAAAGFDLATSEISFGWRFASPPTPHFIPSTGTPPAECPGTASAPAANPGHLCVYESLELNAGARDVNGPTGDGSTYRFGARLFIRSAAAGTFWSGGTWAATSGSSTVARVQTDGTQAGQ
jgi:hypothetical protein